VVLSTGEVLGFDYLVLAMGSRYRMPFDVRLSPVSSPSSSSRLQHPAVVNCVDYRQVSDRYADLVAARRVCIVGGGPVGVEVCGSLWDCVEFVSLACD
jgi:NADPH-dependent 2,4-dienoyl-CoA reductase/sulfur reductase-like enzyme